jgi:hypothetical protein
LQTKRKFRRPPARPHSRFMGIEIVAEIDRIELRVTRAMRCEPSPCGAPFATLLLAPVLGRHEFRRQGHDAIMSGATKVAERSVWKYSVWPPLRARLEQLEQQISFDRKYSVPSKAIKQATAEPLKVPQAAAVLQRLESLHEKPERSSPVQPDRAWCGCECHKESAPSRTVSDSSNGRARHPPPIGADGPRDFDAARTNCSKGTMSRRSFHKVAGAAIMFVWMCVRICRSPHG